MSLDRSNLKKVVDAARLVRAADLRGSVERRPIASPPSPTVQFVTCTDATAGADGYFDGTLAFQDPDTGDWSDGDAVALDMPNDETPVVGTRYGCRFQGNATATGDAVYTAVGGAGDAISFIKCTGTTASGNFYPGTLSTPTTGGWSDGTDAVSFLPLKPDASPTVTPQIGMRYPAVLLTGTQYVLIAPIVKCDGSENLEVG